MIASCRTCWALSADLATDPAVDSSYFFECPNSIREGGDFEVSPATVG
jgi:hypothetical protein